MFDHKAFLQTTPGDPGVYCMYDKTGKLLYVGKAKNLQKRLSSYFRPQDDPRIARLVKRINNIKLNITSSEHEALLLENNLIKSLKPRYNILFRDDKSYPYLFLSHHQYPRFITLRGKPKEKGEIFGPFTSALAVRESLNFLQKTFKLRQCDDTFFKNRSRPCLQYQIKRCTAPCVQYISPEEYKEDVAAVRALLNGKTQVLIDELVSKMQRASDAHEFEQAAAYRNQIVSLRSVTASQTAVKHKGNIDVVVSTYEYNMMAIHMLCIRDGRILDSHQFFVQQSGENENDCVYALSRFLMQFYLDSSSPRDYPNQVIVNHPLEDAKLISDLIKDKIDRKIDIAHIGRGDKSKWVEMALKNAHQAIKQRAVSANVYQGRWQALRAALGISNGMHHIECFDISHSQGEATMASCVVFNEQGACKSEYRSYGLSVDTGDDYAAMKEVLYRRYAKRKAQGQTLPTVLIVDGGKGQMSMAIEVIKECQLDEVLLLGIAKGPTRKAGLEKLFITTDMGVSVRECDLMPHDPALHLLQHIRDEAHRFAITSHRRRLSKSRKQSILESIPGVGAKRRQALLSHFGGLQGLKGASIESIAQVPGISSALAAKIFDCLHEKQ